MSKAVELVDRQEGTAAVAKYGRYYWCVEFPTGGYVYLHADRIEIGPVGELVAWRESRPTNRECLEYEPCTPQIMWAMAPGSWRLFHAADVMGGGAVAVSHWADAREAS